MVKLINNFIVDFIDRHSFVNEASVSVETGTLSAIEDGRLVMHKRINIALREEGDMGDDLTSSISLSPLMAYALVRRLIDCIDGLGLEGLPQVHGRFTRLLLDHLNGVQVDSDILDTIDSIKSMSSEADADGMELEDILPLSLT